jgi:hypothetical protein
MQTRSDYGEYDTSPTVSFSSVYLILSLAAKEGREIGSADVGTAYLNVKMGKSCVICESISDCRRCWWIYSLRHISSIEIAVYM